MKGRLFTIVLSLFLMFGLAFGQADQDAGAAGQDQPAQETPAGQDAGQDAPTDDAATQEGSPEEEEAESQEGAPGADPDAAGENEPGGQDDVAVPGDEEEGAAGQEGAPGETEEGVAGGGQADMAADQSILQALQSNPDFSTFADAVQRAGLDMTLEQEGPFTVLAPTNQAFEQAGIDLASLDQQALTSLVRNHIISGMVSADQLSTLAGVVTLLGNELAVTPAGGQPVAGAEQPEGEVAGGGAADTPPDENAMPDQAEEQPGDVEAAPEAEAPMAQPGATGAVGLRVGNATVTNEAIQTSSGVIYGIDTVLTPEGMQGVEGGGAAQPGTEEPTTPGMDEPTTPAEPTTPGEEPTSPGAESEPTTPDMEQPTTPGEEPTTPGADEPTTPGADEPTTPGTDTPGTDDSGTGDDAGMGDDAGTGDDASGDDTGTGDDNN